VTTSRNQTTALLCLCLTQLGAGWPLPSVRSQGSGDDPDAISRGEPPAHSFTAASSLAFVADDDDSRPDVDGHPHVANALRSAESVIDFHGSTPILRHSASSLILLAPKQGPPPFSRLS
jgi:hypothetical protein